MSGTKSFIVNLQILGQTNLPKMFLPSGAWRGYAAILGGFLLQFTMGAFYSFSNMSTYMTSYMRQNGSPNVTYTGTFLLHYIT